MGDQIFPPNFPPPKNASLVFEKSHVLINQWDHFFFAVHSLQSHNMNISTSKSSDTKVHLTLEDVGSVA